MNELLTVDENLERYIYSSDTEINEFGVNSQYVFKFPNSYGASVIKSPYSYGGTDDLWEVALILWTKDDDWHLHYDSELGFDDVIGFLTDEEVSDLLAIIAAK